VLFHIVNFYTNLFIFQHLQVSKRSWKYDFYQVGFIAAPDGTPGEKDYQKACGCVYLQVCQ